MRKIAVLGGIAAIFVLVLAGSAGMRQTTAASDDVVVSIAGTGLRADITYDITVSNRGTVAIADIYVAGLIPTGGTAATVTATPKGATAVGAQGNVVAWVAASIPAKGSLTFSYKVTAASGAGLANAFVAWKSPTAGSASSASISQASAIEAGSPKRGCLACHVGNYVLAYEAKERGGKVHEGLADDTSVTTCLGCHKAAADRTGLAPKMLRTIVHAAHLNSSAFIEHYGGNCFTCHEISETGAWTLLYEKVVANQWKVPAGSSVNSKGYAAAGLPINSVKPGAQASSASVARGGQIYDKWWKLVPGAAEPKDSPALWATQTTNTRTGGDTWRCKECHGWDYKGKDGVYGSGSHKTGFAGVLGAGSSKTKDQLVGILKGSANPSHNFASQLGDDGIASLADFLKEGLLDTASYIDAAAKKPKAADATRGKELFGRTCAGCHGTDGAALNFGSEASPEYVGTVAKDNPWEFTHKVRFGQPGTSMPAGGGQGWTIQDVMDVLAYAQSLKSN